MDQKKTKPSTTDGVFSFPSNVAAAFAYLFWFVTGLLVLAVEKKNAFVRFHAMQSVVTFGSLVAAMIVASWIPFFGWLLSFALQTIALILWIVLMVKAYCGAQYRLPVFGDIAEEQLKGWK